MTITFTNDGSGPIELTGAQITGAHPDDFLFALLDPNDCVVSAKGPDAFNDLQAAESCDVQIQFIPHALGARAATLSISYNDGSPQVANAALSGTGTAHVCDAAKNGTAGNGGFIQEDTFIESRVVQRIEDQAVCQPSSSVIATPEFTQFEFGCDVELGLGGLFGDLYEWPEAIVADGTLRVVITAIATEIQYSCSSDTVTAPIDIKFCSNPNGFNCKKNGVLPVTIFGTSGLDVSEISIGTVELCLASDTSQCVSALGAGPAKDRGNPDTDLGTARCNRDVANPDGRDDVDVKFDSREVASLFGCSDLRKGDASPALLIKGQLNDGTPFISNAVNSSGIDQLLIQSK